MSGSTLQGKSFFCREWAFHKLVHCLDSRHSSRTCGTLIVGGPGSGKTALCSEIVWPTLQQGKKRSLGKRLLAHHFCQGHDKETLSVSKFIQGLVASLIKSTLVPGFSEKLRDPVVQAALEPAYCERHPDEAFKNGILVPLCALTPPGRNCFILVDSIDEGYPDLSPNETTTFSRTVAELLANHHELFPPWLCLVCSARKQSKAVTRMFTGFRKLSLDDLRKSYIVRDVQQYILNRLDHDDSIRKHLNKETAEMLNQLHIKSNGCVLYLERVLNGVSDGFITLQDVVEIPATLNGLYLWECQKMFARKHFSKLRPLFCVLLASTHPMTESELYSCARTRNLSLTKEDFGERLGLMSRLLITHSENRLALFHHSFAEWLQDVKVCTQKYLCSQAEGHAMLALRYTCSASDLTPTQVQDFARNLLKAGMEPPLDENHLAMWMMWAGTPLYDCPIRQKSKHQDVVQLLSKAGARVVDIDRNSLIILDALEKEETLKSFLDSGASVNQVDSNGRSLLANACYSGNTNAVYFLLSQNTDLDICDRTGQTALGLAARQGHTEIVKLLIERGSKIDHVDKEGWTPLRSSAWGGHTEVVIALLNAGAKVDCSDTDKRTALRAAAWGGHADIVNKLIENGAQVSQMDQDGRTALIAAAYMGHVQIVGDLLEHGADINHTDCDGRTALSVAAMSVAVNQGHTKVISLLIEKGADVDHSDNEGMSPLIMASYEGHEQVVELLLEGKADVDHIDNSNRTALIAAASMGHTSIVKALLYWDAAVDSIDNEGRTVLCIAAVQGNCEVVKILLDRGLDEMHKDNHGWTPLHMSAHEGHTKVCRVILDLGSHMTVDVADRDGRTPLILACQEGHIETVNVLLDYGGDVHNTSHDGRNGVRASALEGHKELTQLLIDRGGNVNYVDAEGRTTLYMLSLENKVPMVKFLLQRGANPEIPDLEGRTGLHVASWQGHVGIVEALLQFNANVNAMDKERRSPLQSAAWQGHVQVLELLLLHRANINHMCNQGASALCIAAQEGHVEVVRALLHHGAEPNHADRQGRTAMKVAVKGGHHQVVELLEKCGAFPPVSPSRSSDQQSRGSSCSIKDLDMKGPGMLSNSALNSSSSGSPDSTYEKGRSVASSRSSSNLTNSAIQLMPPHDVTKDPSFMEQIQMHVESPLCGKPPRTRSPDPGSIKSSSSRITSGSSFQTIPENITTAHSSDYIYQKQKIPGRRNVTGSLPRRSPSPGRQLPPSTSPVVHEAQVHQAFTRKTSAPEMRGSPKHPNGTPPIPTHTKRGHRRSSSDANVHASLVISNPIRGDAQLPHDLSPITSNSSTGIRNNGFKEGSPRHVPKEGEALCEPFYHVLEGRVSRSSSLSQISASGSQHCTSSHDPNLLFSSVLPRAVVQGNNHGPSEQANGDQFRGHHHIAMSHGSPHQSPHHQQSSNTHTSSSLSSKGFHVRAISQPATHMYPPSNHVADTSHVHRKPSLPVTFNQCNLQRVIASTSNGSAPFSSNSSKSGSPESRPRRNGIVTNPNFARFTTSQNKTNLQAGRGIGNQQSIISRTGPVLTPLEQKHALKMNIEGQSTVNGFKKETPL